MRLSQVETVLLGDNAVLSVIIYLQVVYQHFYNIESIFPTHFEGKNDEKLASLNRFGIFKLLKVPAYINFEMHCLNQPAKERGWRGSMKFRHRLKSWCGSKTIFYMFRSFLLYYKCSLYVFVTDIHLFVYLVVFTFVSLY